MKPVELARWEKTRAGGKRRFLTLYGVLGWGLPMFALTTFVTGRGSLTIDGLALGVAIWALGGAFFGWCMWTLNESRYRRTVQTRAQGSD